MKAEIISKLIFLCVLLVAASCSYKEKENQQVSKNYLDTLQVTHSMKGWELYSWPEGSSWCYSVLRGTNRVKTLYEVTSSIPSAEKLIQVTGSDSLKLLLDKFPENEIITWIGKTWLQQCWRENYGNLQLPPQDIIDDLTKYCIQKKLTLQMTN
jgi:hypothetical protein